MGSEMCIRDSLKSVRELKNDTYMAYFDEYERKYDINGYRKKKTKAQK